MTTDNEGVKVDGARLKALRGERGWRAHELATRAKVGQASVYRAESGHVSVRTLARICAALEVDPRSIALPDVVPATEERVTEYHSSLAFLLALELGVGTADRVVEFLREHGIDLERLR